MELNELKLTARRQALLVKMGIHSVEELLKTYPFRYETIDQIPFKDWKEHQSVAFEGLICSQARVIRFGKKRSMTKFKVLSWNEELEVTLFNRPWIRQFPFGKTITVFGTYQGNDKVTGTNYNFQSLVEQVGMNPVYTVSQGMRQNEFRDIMKKALVYTDQMPSYVPVRYQKKYRLLDHGQALYWIHLPPNPEHLQAAMRTLKYEEFLLFQCVMQATNQKESLNLKKPKQVDLKKVDAWIRRLPYALTADQKSAIDDVLSDLSGDTVMFRLIQGDVGCGKSVVAFAVLYATALSGYQSAFLVPTELLARQHYSKMKEMGLPVTLYVSALSVKEKNEILKGIKINEIAIVVGTHSLFQEAVYFSNLGLVITDEQQRFGVRQRRALLEKGSSVDFLMMSATPIPRTYAHFIYGNMDISNIRTMPPNRYPVETKYVPGKSMKPVVKEITAGLDEGRQCYVVCPAIEDNEELNIRSATSIYEGMKKTWGQTYRIGLLHGKMSSEEKDEVMHRFIDHELDILVSTTVIEVGIDVHNATLMVIYDAHRFGLSTLHQLRGRVSRDSKQGYCYLLSGSKDVAAIQRLKKMEELKDGFSVTEYDLQLRGPGDILGVRQSGLPGFILGDIHKDKAMMETCVQDAKEILESRSDPDLLAYIKEAVEKAEYFD